MRSSFDVTENNSFAYSVWRFSTVWCNSNAVFTYHCVLWCIHHRLHRFLFCSFRYVLVWFLNRYCCYCCCWCSCCYCCCRYLHVFVHRLCCCWYRVNSVLIALIQNFHSHFRFHLGEKKERNSNQFCNLWMRQTVSFVCLNDAYHQLWAVLVCLKHRHRLEILD